MITIRVENWLKCYRFAPILRLLGEFRSNECQLYSNGTHPIFFYNKLGEENCAMQDTCYINARYYRNINEMSSFCNQTENYKKRRREENPNLK